MGSCPPSNGKCWRDKITDDKPGDGFKFTSPASSPHRSPTSAKSTFQLNHHILPLTQFLSSNPLPFFIPSSNHQPQRWLQPEAIASMATWTRTRERSEPFSRIALTMRRTRIRLPMRLSLVPCSLLLARLRPPLLTSIPLHHHHHPPRLPHLLFLCSVLAQRLRSSLRLPLRLHTGLVLGLVLRLLVLGLLGLLVLELLGILLWLLLLRLPSPPPSSCQLRHWHHSREGSSRTTGCLTRRTATRSRTGHGHSPFRPSSTPSPPGSRCRPGTLARFLTATRPQSNTCGRRQRSW